MNICSPEMCLHLARQLWSAVLVGDPAPRVQALYERMKAPRPGDVVVELTGYNTPAIDRVGMLVRRAREPLPNWDVDRDGPNAGEDVWYIRTDVGETRWVNASFIAVPPLDQEQAEKEGWPR